MTKLRTCSFLFLTQQLASREMFEFKGRLNQFGLCSFSRAWSSKYKNYLKYFRHKFPKQQLLQAETTEQKSYRTRSSKTIFGHFIYIFAGIDLHVCLFLLLLQILILQFRLLPSEVLIQLSFLHVLLVELLVAIFDTYYTFIEFFYFILLLLARRQALQIVVQNGVLLYCVLKILELFLCDILFLCLCQQFLQFIGLGSQHFFDVFQLDSFFFQPLEISTFFKTYLLSSHILEFFYGHMSWSFSTRFEKTFIKSLLIRDQSSLIIYFFLILYKSLSSNFCLLFFYLLCNQILQSQLPSFFKKLLYVLEFLFAMRQSAQGDF